MNLDPKNILNHVFGYADFRGDQAEIVDRVINGGDALVLMPTGGGKSLCYQIPSIIRNGVGVVVSPLIKRAKSRPQIARHSHPPNYLRVHSHDENLR